MTGKRRQSPPLLGVFLAAVALMGLNLVWLILPPHNNSSSSHAHHGVAQVVMVGHHRNGPRAALSSKKEGEPPPSKLPPHKTQVRAVQHTIPKKNLYVMEPKAAGHAALVSQPKDTQADSAKAHPKKAQQPKRLDRPNTWRDSEDQEQEATRQNPRNISYHVVFSTGCSIFQDWQSYVFFYHILQSGQQGNVTRIVSGCNPEEELVLRRLFAKEIAVMAPNRFHVHFTPDYSHVLPEIKKGFKYFNKPFGMVHWMEHELGYSKTAPKSKVHDDTIVILMDPDQMILRPFTNNFTDSIEMWRNKEVDNYIVQHGAPFAQQYGFGLQWKDKVNMSHIFPGQHSPVEDLPRKEAFRHYMAMGPPYIATARDMYSLVTTWSDFAPKIYLYDYPHLLAEMFGYNLAAAHLQLPHEIAQSFHVSDVYAPGEGWKLVREVSPHLQCQGFPNERMPHVLHYCQRYRLGKFFISKYKLPKNFISCESPLLLEPPADIALRYDYSIDPGPGNIKKAYKDQNQVSEMAFAMCHLMKGLNEAATYYKDHHCVKGEANYDKIFRFFDNMTLPEDANATNVV